VSTYIDADVFIKWEKGEFDLPAWLENEPEETFAFPATVWQQLAYGLFARDSNRARRRARQLERIGAPVSPFLRKHALRAARIAAELKREAIGFADCQIAACALEDGARLLSFNSAHFGRVDGLNLVVP
jgi:predicted nucleic acid-binding protein